MKTLVDPAADTPAGSEPVNAISTLTTPKARHLPACANRVVVPRVVLVRAAVVDTVTELLLLGGLLGSSRIDRHTIQLTFKADGKVIATATETVSKDGKTMTFHRKGLTAQGQPEDSVMILEKQMPSS
jgi:hypothetical protein